MNRDTNNHENFYEAASYPSRYNREHILKLLQWNDPNGIWDDEDSKAEGLDVLTLEEAIEQIKEAAK